METYKDQANELTKKTFLKLRSDYAFKRTFATPQNAEVLRKFLNALFEGKMEIDKIDFQDKEVLPPDENGKRIVYDAYCTTTTGYHFVVEMQRKQSDLFGKRMVFYISSCVFRQGERGGSYKFNPVYLIVITDFDIKPLQKRLINEVVLMERNTNTVFTEDFKIFFLSLAQVGKSWNECNSKLERQLYLIKNMEKLNKESKPYKSGEFREMFDAAEIASMSQEDIVAYRNSIMIEMERESQVEFAKEEGREEAMLEVAKAMKKNGMPLGDIMLYTGLTEQEIQPL